VGSEARETGGQSVGTSWKVKIVKGLGCDVLGLLLRCDWPQGLRGVAGDLARGKSRDVKRTGKKPSAEKRFCKKCFVCGQTEKGGFGGGE